MKALLIIARVSGFLSVAFMALALIGQTFAPEPAVFSSTFEIILFSFFPIGVTIGNIISLAKRHIIGGAITCLCLLVFHLMRPDIGLNIWIDSLSAPGILFLIHGIAKK